jgi:hypothetical protein
MLLSNILTGCYFLQPQLHSLDHVFFFMQITSAYQGRTYSLPTKPHVLLQGTKETGLSVNVDIATHSCMNTTQN